MTISALKLEIVSHPYVTEAHSDTTDQTSKRHSSFGRLYPNKLKNWDFPDAEQARFDSEKTDPLLDIGVVFSGSKMACSVKGKTNSSACLGIPSAKKICYLDAPAFQFRDIPDVAMDCFMVSNGKPLGTCGLGPCFAVCMIGKTANEAPVLGLCHKSSLEDMSDVLQTLRHAMVYQENAVVETIKTYVIGGESPAKESLEGTFEEEKEILIMGKRQNIAEVLFNQVLPQSEESLSVVVTPQSVYASKEDLFHVTGKDDGIGVSEYILEYWCSVLKVYFCYAVKLLAS